MREESSELNGSEPIATESQPKRVIGIPFKPGNPGRPKGIVNRRQQLVNAVLDAIEELGGVDGAKGYIKKLAPEHLAPLVGKVIPKEQAIEHTLPEGTRFTLNIGTAGNRESLAGTNLERLPEPGRLELPTSIDAIDAAEVVERSVERAEGQP